LRAWYGANIVGHEGKYSVDYEDLQDEPDSILFILLNLEILSKVVLRKHLRQLLAACTQSVHIRKRWLDH
jgi:hypothetical protein